jgi:peptidoglycan/xylan/chitin deacetylase (PgdA/CDA1 family)
MSRFVTIVMYHFVRDLERSRFREIKALDLSEFREQLGYIRRHYSVIAMEDLMAGVGGGEGALPPRPILLTFDDGYIDHYTNVFPLLDAYGVQGSFFPPARSVLEHKVLDVNKIHFILASTCDKSKIIGAIFSMMDEMQGHFRLEPKEQFYERIAQPNRFDPADVIFIKRALQRELPEKVRNEVLNRLFAQFVTQDEAAFAAELYMSTDQLACMHRHGMYIGSHGFDHLWMDTLEPPAQEREVGKSLEFIKSIGCDTKNWAMCYPYGGWNKSLVQILREKGCKVGLTTNVAIADLESENPLLLSRLDTNDLPKRAGAEPNDWTRRVLQEIGQ